MDHLRVEILEQRTLFALYGADVTFGTSGQAANTPAHIALDVLRSGKIYTVGLLQLQSQDDETEQFEAIATQLNSDGTPDNSFGDQGVVVFPVDDVDAYSRTRLYGVKGNGLVALKTDATIDPTFGTDGVVDVNRIVARVKGITDDAPVVQSVDFAPGGGSLVRLLVKVDHSGTIKQDSQIIQLKADGTVDTSFGKNGAIIFPTDYPGWNDDQERALTVTSNGIVVLNNGQQARRFKLDGTVDTSFGANGILSLGFSPEAITEQSDGKLLFVTLKDTVQGGHPVRRLVRLNIDGTPDQSFGDNGQAIMPAALERFEVGQIVIDDQNRILVAADGTLYRFSSTGVLDAAPFDGTLPAAEADPLRLAFDSQDGIVTGNHFFVSRLETITPVQVGTDHLIHLRGSAINDDVSVVTGAGNKIDVTFNGALTHIDPAGIVGIDAQLGDGSDHFLETYSLPTTVLAGGGDDSITVAGARDSVDGGLGNDLIHGGGGSDVLLGGDGSDTIFGEEGLDTLDGNAGRDSLNGGVAADLLIGEGQPDTLVGGPGNDTLNGGSGNDRLEGQGGNDILNGSTGNDKLTGGDGPDTMHGGVGDDQFFSSGDAFADILSGGAGADVAVTDSIDVAHSIETRNNVS